jgi:hypothetical protein
VRVELATEGGFASLPGLRRPVTIDVDNLPPNQAAEIRAQLDATNFFSLPERLPAPPGAADYRAYTLTVEDGDHCHTVHVPEIGAPPALLELIDRLQSLR